MDILSKDEIKQTLQKSRLVTKYSENINRESAEELLIKKIAKASKGKEIKETRKVHKSTKKEESFFESMSKNTMVRQLGRTLTREITRGLLGILGIK